MHLPQIAYDGLQDRSTIWFSEVLFAVANFAIYFRNEYAAFAKTATWYAILPVKIFLGAATRGLGVYIKQAVRRERTDLREIVRWMIVGAFMVGVLVFGILYPVIRYLELSPVQAALFDLFIYAPFVSLPLSFIFYEYFISKETIKKKMTLKNIFVSGRKSVKSFYFVQIIFWFTTLTIGWTWFAEYMDLYIVNMSVIWSALLAFMFDTTKREQDRMFERARNKQTITVHLPRR